MYITTLILGSCKFYQIQFQKRGRIAVQVWKSPVQSSLCLVMSNDLTPYEALCNLRVENEKKKSLSLTMGLWDCFLNIGQN